MCQALERAYDPNVIVDVDATARPHPSGNWYIYDDLDCGSRQMENVEDHLHAECAYGNTSASTTLTVSWQPDPNEP